MKPEIYTVTSLTIAMGAMVCFICAKLDTMQQAIVSAIERNTEALKRAGEKEKA